MCGAAERLRPVCSEALDMLRVEAVAEGMADHVVGHYPMMPSLGKTAQTTDSTRRLKDSTHIRMITKRPTSMQDEFSLLPGPELSACTTVNLKPAECGPQAVDQADWSDLPLADIRTAPKSNNRSLTLCGHVAASHCRARVFSHQRRAYARACAAPAEE